MSNSLIEKQWLVERTRLNDFPEKQKKADAFFRELEKKNFTGLFDKVSDEMYFNGPGLSRSDMYNLHGSCLEKMKHNTYDAPVREEKQCFIDGDYQHRVVFQPDTLENFISDGTIYMKAIDLRGEQSKNVRATKEYKQAKAQYLADGYKIVTTALYKEANAIAESIQKRFGDVLAHGYAEKVAYAIDPISGLLLKVKPDFISLDDNDVITGIVDLKTTKDDPETFCRGLHKFGYHVQDVYYRKVLGLATNTDIEQFTFMCVEKEPPYLTYAVNCDDAYREIGATFIYHATTTLRDAITSNIWSGYKREYLAMPPQFLISQGE